jgi:hypothetical protein
MLKVLDPMILKGMPLDPMILKGMPMSKKSSHTRVGGCDENPFLMEVNGTKSCFWTRNQKHHMKFPLHSPKRIQQFIEGF